MHYIHDTPGRLRIKIRALKKNDNAARGFKSFLEELDGIRSVCVNLTTGSVTIHYDHQLFDARAILQALQRQGLLETPVPAPVKVTGGNTVLDRAIGHAAETLGRAVFDRLMEKAVERAAMAVIAAVL
ncbi:MAG: HMA2 domain-containing protein [Pseudomonadota bacterium]